MKAKRKRIRRKSSEVDKRYKVKIVQFSASSAKSYMERWSL